MTPVDRVIELLKDHQTTGDREPAVEAFSLLEKYLEVKRIDETIICKTCQKEIPGAKTGTEYCGPCYKIRKAEQQRAWFGRQNKGRT